MGRIFCPFHALNAQDRLKVYAFPVEKKQAENQSLRDWNYWLGCDVMREVFG